jgi:hypothetical protein
MVNARGAPREQAGDLPPIRVADSAVSARRNHESASSPKLIQIHRVK